MAKQYNKNEMVEWPYTVNVEDIGHEPVTVSFEADERERTDLARRLGILFLAKAKARVTVQNAGNGMFHAIGTVNADVTQNCVVSGVPVNAHIEEEFDGWFGDKASAVSFARAKTEHEAKKGNVESEILEESVDPDAVINGKIDVGELATQYLCLAIDPYPRAHDAKGEFLIEPPKAKGGAKDEPARKSPFEALKDWKEKR